MSHDDAPLLKTLIEEFATYERLSAVISEEKLRQDGFGTRPKFQTLIAEARRPICWLRPFLRLRFVISRLRHFLGRPVRPATVSWEECRAGVVDTCCPNNGRSQRLWNHVQCSRLERWSNAVLSKNRRHGFGRLENGLPQAKTPT